MFCITERNMIFETGEIHLYYEDILIHTFSKKNSLIHICIVLYFRAANEETMKNEIKNVYKGYPDNSSLFY